MSLFGARLRELREAAGLSRKGLAEQAGMKSEAGIRDLEQGRRQPTWETVQALADALGVSVEAFREEPTAPSAETEPRKRGRPRKSSTSAPAGESSPTSAKPMKPGRPRKAPVSVETAEGAEPVAEGTAVEAAEEPAPVKLPKKPRKK